MSADLADRLARHLAAQRLFREPGRALVAVSGGPDSLALLDLLAGLAPGLGLTLVVAHADHGIAPGSAAVAEMVQALATSRYGCETVVGRLVLGPGASETAARTARYRFLRQVQDERGAHYLVTAHHADDQAETVLLRVLRGTAPAGLGGIPARGPRGLVRPLLPFKREELREWVRARGLAAVEDPANRDPRHLRSWVRVALLPLIAERMGAASGAALLEVARHARAEVRAWDAVVDHLWGLEARVSPGRFDVACDALSSYDKWLAGRILRAVSRRAGLGLTPSAAGRLAGFATSAASGRRWTLPGGSMAEVAFGRLVVSRPERAPEAIALDGSAGALEFGRFHVAWRPDAAPERLVREGWTTWLLPGPLAVRTAAEGERLMPLGGAGRRKVVRLLMDARVPRGDRAVYPVVEAAGEAVWVPGVCRGARALPGPGTDAVRVDVTIR